MPFLSLLTRRLQDPFADRPDEAGLLRQRYELLGTDEAALGMLPAKKRLAADDAAESILTSGW